MKRIFYFTGYRLRVLHWKGKKLVGSSSFEPTDLGFEKFHSYLSQTKNIPGKFLVDVIEEDFRREIIPHVGSKDRKSVISRLLDRYYRASKNYCYSEIIGREKTGRKDDVVLIGAMTNPQLIKPWITILDECEVPLSGIWSLPIISKALLKIIKAQTGVVLLISQQVNSNIRQTLFRDCKLISSRQSIINQDINNSSEIGELSAPEVRRTIDFLRAQGLVGANEIINLHVLGSDEQMSSLQKAFKINTQQTVSIHRIADIQEKLGLSDADEKFSGNIFSWFCASQSLVPSHYGENEIFSRYHSRLAAAALYAASLLTFITGALLTESNISSAMEHEKSIGFLKQEENSYKEIYSKKFKDFEGVFQNAGIMNSAVELAEQIKINSMTSPLDFLISLSDTLSQHDDSDIRVDKIEWKAINIDKEKNKIHKANFTDKLNVKHSAIVTGRINVPENRYRESVNRIQTIIETLKASSRIENVITLKMPVDLRSESKFSTESGADIDEQIKKELSGIFSLEIIMQAPDHV
ncbi:hypothetical protein MNBD_GAMMA06-1148 [hydrothermal vent metagenome]|uniref:Uncharacterized protein n=1 Tax=hydrothermal vent metagenome TaxID=652676 RepID=A0A3B0WMT2_9ZZZZ